ncbi:hypothetical protein [Sorangium sp. So ce131]|uniref:hypothetical protein n=1 Tax=Sorangium sp. So ce131 TaxID=3133282 RepID=UPI003F5E2CC0
MAVRIRDQIVAEEVRSEGRAAEARWQNWMNLGPDRREWGIVRSFAAATWRSVWPNWSAADRRDAAEVLLSPFEPDEARLLEFLDEIEAAFKHA